MMVKRKDDRKQKVTGFVRAEVAGESTHPKLGGWIRPRLPLVQNNTASVLLLSFHSSICISRYPLPHFHINYHLWRWWNQTLILFKYTNSFNFILSQVAHGRQYEPQQLTVKANVSLATLLMLTCPNGAGSSWKMIEKDANNYNWADECWYFAVLHQYGKHWYVL